MRHARFPALSACFTVSTTRHAVGHTLSHRALLTRRLRTRCQPSLALGHVVAGPRSLVPRRRGSSLFFFDDVNRGLLGRGCASADANILGHQFWLFVFAKAPVRRDKSTCPHASDLISLRKLGFTLSFVRALPIVFVERNIHSRCRIRLFLRKQLVHAFRRAEGARSQQTLGGRNSLVQRVVEMALNEGVLLRKLVFVVRAVFAWGRTRAVTPSIHDSSNSLHP